MPTFRETTATLSPTARKRPRKIWSCLECRRKKLQCDHGLPACGRCTKNGSAAKCVYATGKKANSTQTSEVLERLVEGQEASNSLQNAPNRDLVARIDSLEKVLQSRSVAGPYPPTTSVLETSDAAKQLRADGGIYPDYLDWPLLRAGRNNSLVRGTAFRTKFNGNTRPESLPAHIPGFTSFTSDAFATFSAFKMAQQGLNISEYRPGLSGQLTEGGLKALLPPREEVDCLIQLYFDSFDNIYPVIHVPTFQQDHSRLWTEDGSSDDRTLILMLIIVAIGYCLSKGSSASTDGQNLPRDKATMILDSCESWLRLRVQKFDVLIDFQISFLLLLARLIDARRCKRTWAAAGNVLRTFQCAGLHRDPEQLSQDTSQLEKSMRRRLWGAAAEFELQAAFEHGMPAMSWLRQSDMNPPPNANDSSLEPHSMSTYTKCSFLAVNGTSLRLRHELNSELNDMSQTMSFDRAVWYTNELRSLLQVVPTEWTGPGADAVHALLLITLHQFILAIHEQQLQQSTSTVERQFSRFALLDSAIQMLDSHKAAMAGNVVELLCGDHVRAALAICFAYASADPTADRLLLSAFERMAFDAMSWAVALYSEKFRHLGGGRVQLWLICAAEGVMRSKVDPEERMPLMQRAVDQFWKPLQELISARGLIPFDETKYGSECHVSTSMAEQVPASNRQTVWPIGDAQMLDEWMAWNFDDSWFDFSDFMKVPTL